MQYGDLSLEFVEVLDLRIADRILSRNVDA